MNCYWNFSRTSCDFMAACSFWLADKGWFQKNGEELGMLGFVRELFCKS